MEEASLFISYNFLVLPVLIDQQRLFHLHDLDAAGSLQRGWRGNHSKNQNMPSCIDQLPPSYIPYIDRTPSVDNMSYIVNHYWGHSL